MVGERRISFVLHEADAEGESENSSNTTVTAQGEEGTPEENKHGKCLPIVLDREG